MAYQVGENSNFMFAHISLPFSSTKSFLVESFVEEMIIYDCQGFELVDIYFYFSSFFGSSITMSSLTFFSYDLSIINFGFMVFYFGSSSSFSIFSSSFRNNYSDYFSFISSLETYNFSFSFLCLRILVQSLSPLKKKKIPHSKITQIVIKRHQVFYFVKKN